MKAINNSVTIYDVANWFLSKESMTPKKLQKLCYYYKAWGLALYDEDLLPGYEFEAWVHGPVNPELYSMFKGYLWKDIPMTEDNSKYFSEKEIELLESVWLTYGNMTANALEAQTHVDLPCRNARVGLDEFSHSNAQIKHEDMKNFYRTVYQQNQGD